MHESLEQKRAALHAFFQRQARVLVAYSGGVDSALVAWLAYQALGEQALAVTAVSPSLLPEDLDVAQAQAEWIGIRHELVYTHELENPDYASNPINRCYFCKQELHDTLKPLAQARGFAHVVDGVNADDLRDYRPGIQAGRERGAQSPLAELGLSKLEVRKLSRYLGLPWWDRPAQPCLSSRFPYGEAITVDKLHRVGRAEVYLRNLGWQPLRVRSIGDTARIELPAGRLAEFVAQTDLPALVAVFRSFGFTTVTLDLEGFRSGKLNQGLVQSHRFY
ncbi:MAG: ATP-dependent sacrificial sulfur transferase LarE [Gloeomargaritaceae cyanobacterium C42_A2020_066]|nr:ATP-dependent sacrificial sulfur transferase LarE [Gloeomargaritaceae cyanobacterium C42_A2020_066]